MALLLTLSTVDVLSLVWHGGKIPKQADYYLSLGDSVAYGYQPDLNVSSGFSDDLYADLRTAGVTNVVNYGCGGESTQTMIVGNCPDRALRHVPYLGTQLSTAVSFLQHHVGSVSVMTLIIGADDVFGDFNQTTCQADANTNSDLERMDKNLTKTILPQLTQALRSSMNYPSTRFVMLDYYDPFAKLCSNSTAFVQTLDQHLSADAAAFRIPLVDSYAAFGGSQQADKVCAYTWICSSYQDIHPTTQGYRILADAIESVIDVSQSGPGLKPAPVIATPAAMGTPASSQ